MVKLNKGRPAMRKLGIGEAFWTISASNPAQRHMTVVLEAPLVLQSGIYDSVCSCMGWTRHKHCWHTDEAEEVATAQSRFYDAVELLQQIANAHENREITLSEDYLEAIDNLAALLPDELPEGQQELTIMKEDNYWGDAPESEEE